MSSLQFDLFQSLSIAAVINGCIFCVLLLLKQENRQANRFLALLIFSICFSLLTQLWVDLGVYNRYPWLHWLPGGLGYLIGPSFYLYVRSLTDPRFQFRPVHWLHFGWIVFDYFHSVYHLVYGRTVPYPRLHNFTEAIDVYVIFPLLIYVYYALRHIRNYRHLLLDQYSATEALTLDWLRQLVRLGAVVLVPILLMLLVDNRIFYDYDMEFFEGTLLQYDFAINFFSMIMIYWLSIGGFRQSQIVVRESVSSDTVTDGKDHEDTLGKILQAMEEDELYLDPILSLGALSRHTSLTEKEISTVINQGLNKNFYTFVNEFRVEVVKRKLVDPEFDHYTILSIAFEAGFNSKATFNRIFKEYTGQSPRAFRTNRQ